MRAAPILCILALACGEDEVEEPRPPHDCQGYLVEVGDAPDGAALATELNAMVFGSEELCGWLSGDLVSCGPTCSADDWERAEAEAEAERVRAYLTGTHPELVTAANPSVSSCACRIY